MALSEVTQAQLKRELPGWRSILLIVLASATALFLALLLYGWFVFVSPWGHEPPNGYPAIDASRPHQVFAYGTLRFSVVRWLILGDDPEHRPAVLPGYKKQGLNIVAAPHASVKGQVFPVTPSQLRRLDRYERIGLRYERVELRLQDKSKAWVYRRLSKSSR